MYRSILISCVGKYVAYVINLASLMVLARLFTPDQFGSIACIQIVFSFAFILAEFGIGPTIVGLNKLEPKDRDGLYSFTVCLGLVIGILVLISTELIVQLFQNQNLRAIIAIASISIPLAALGILPQAQLQRDQRFIIVGIADGGCELVGTLATLGFLYFLDPVLSLALRMPVRFLARWLMLYSFCGRTEFGRPHFGTKLSAIRQIFHISSYQFGYSFISFFTNNLDATLVSRYYGASSLGIYDKTNQIIRYPLILLVGAVSPALQPALRHHDQNAQTIEAIHRIFIGRVIWVGVAGGVAVMMGSSYFVPILLGRGWDDVQPILRILALTIPLQMVVATCGSFFQAMNRQDLLFRFGVQAALVSVISIVIGISFGNLNSLAWALVISSYINFFQAYMLLYGKAFKQSPGIVFKATAFALMICPILYAVHALILKPSP